MAVEAFNPIGSASSLLTTNKLKFQHKVKIMSEATKVTSHFSTVSGSDCRHVFDEDGKKLLGVIIKIGRGKYRVQRVDGKTRTKETLQDAFRTVRRAN